MASTAVLSPVKQSPWSGYPSSIQSPAAASSWQALECIQSLLGVAVSPCRNLVSGKALRGFSPAGPPASTSVMSSVKEEEEVSERESPVSPLKDVQPSVGPGE